jgi:hypothetical protein
MDLKGQEILRRIRRLKMDFGCTVNAAVRTPKQKTPHGAGLFTTGGAETITQPIGYRCPVPHSMSPQGFEFTL